MHRLNRGIVNGQCTRHLHTFNILKSENSWLATRLVDTHTIPSDGLWQKLFVGTLVILDLLSSVLAMMWFYTLFIDGWGNIAAYASAVTR